MFRNLSEKIKKTYSKTSTFFENKTILSAIVISFFVALLNEILSQRSLLKGFVFVFTKPLHFLCGMAIIMVFESLAMLSNKRKFMTVFVSLLWLALGITNFIIRCFRQTPFSFMDLRLIKSVFPIVEVYLSIYGLIGIIVFLTAIISLLIYRFIKSKKRPVNIKKALISLAVSFVTFASLLTLLKVTGLFPDHFLNLQSAYKSNGFTCCFTFGIFDKGMNKPAGYDEKIHPIASEYSGETKAKETDDETKDKEVIEPVESDSPNVIFVQLESFYDLNLLNGFKFDRDPCPNFTKLKQSCQSGYLTVPSIGAGTANTEFEVLTGMSLKWFGAGEYPYETIMQKTTCESICYNIANHGYTCHAVHNYRATFYDRLNVFSRLGFDTFTPIEYMSGIKSGWKGWAQDSVLTRYIGSALDSTDTPDLVYCITVQCHGIYPTTEFVTEKHNVNILSLPEEANEYSFSYFADQLYETDRFIGELIDTVDKRNEDTIIVFFGDHLPNIGIEEDWIPEGSSLYDTEYIIWSNCKDAGKDKNLTSYQLSSEIMSILGYDDGAITKLHQSRTAMSEEKYIEHLELLQYDILYGNHTVYNGDIPFEQKDIRLGTEEIKITGIEIENDGCFIIGENFTEFSSVLINGDRCSTDFISENKLHIETVPEKDDIVVVAQYGAKLSFTRLGETKPYIVK